MENKRGQGMSTSTIILLILGLIILVVLILGFTLGWKNIVPWIKSDNIENIKTSCNVACSTNSEYTFCTTNQTVRDGVNDAFEATCEELSTMEKYSSYGIAECATITCD